MTRPVTVPNTFSAQTGNIPLSQLDSNNAALVAAINDPATYTNYAVDTGAANAYVITLNPAPSTQASLAGVPITFKAVNANTTASTLNINGLGVLSVTHNDGTGLNAGDIPAGGMMTVIYDGTKYMFPTRATQSGTVLSIGTASASGSGSFLAVATFSPTINVSVGDIVTATVMLSGLGGAGDFSTYPEFKVLTGTAVLSSATNVPYRIVTSVDNVVFVVQKTSFTVLIGTAGTIITFGVPSYTTHGTAPTSMTWNMLVQVTRVTP